MHLPSRKVHKYQLKTTSLSTHFILQQCLTLSLAFSTGIKSFHSALILEPVQGITHAKTLTLINGSAAKILMLHEQKAALPLGHWTKGKAIFFF